MMRQALTATLVSIAFMAVPTNSSAAAPDPTPTPTLMPTPTGGSEPTGAPTTTPTGPSWPGPYDAAAIGASVSGAPGSVVRIRVGMINHGPSGLIGHPGVQGGFQGFGVTIPPGTKVVGAPQGCENRFEQHREFPVSASGCVPSGLAAGESIILILDLKIVGPVVGTGTVTRFFEAGLTVGTKDDLDTNSANNVARIVVRVTRSAAELAATGTPTAGIVLTGVATVVLGALLVLLARRRRAAARSSS